MGVKSDKSLYASVSEHFDPSGILQGTGRRWRTLWSRSMANKQRGMPYVSDKSSFARMIIVRKQFPQQFIGRNIFGRTANISRDTLNLSMRTSAWVIRSLCARHSLTLYDHWRWDVNTCLSPCQRENDRGLWPMFSYKTG